MGHRSTKIKYVALPSQSGKCVTKTYILSPNFSSKLRRLPPTNSEGLLSVARSLFSNTTHTKTTLEGVTEARYKTLRGTTGAPHGTRRTQGCSQTTVEISVGCKVWYRAASRDCGEDTICRDDSRRLVSITRRLDMLCQLRRCSSQLKMN